jgi:hypothetical protein
MRRAPLLLVVLPLLTGCVDALGIGSSCSSEMRDVRAAHGGPPDETQRDEDRGDYTEVWYFDDSRRRYTFRWGVSYAECDVQSGSFTRAPLRDS